MSAAEPTAPTIPEERHQLEQFRIDKLDKLKALGVDPFGSRFDDRAAIAAVRELAPAEDAGDEFEKPRVRIAGRVLRLRDKGKVVFADLADQTGTIQVFAGKKQVGEQAWELLGLLDLWDLIGVEGELGRTRMGEVTVFADKVVWLTKTLAHPPDKHAGARDVEIRLRRRYVDMVQSPEVLATFRRRSDVIRAIRQHLYAADFLEVETPTMQSIAGGAAAKPFVTHHNALDLDLFLRIAPELYLKRLLVGGMERVFEIGRVYRNEGLSPRHNPEFTMLELYQAFGDYRSMMDLTESMIVAAIDAVGGGLTRKFGDVELDFTPPWRRATYAELLREHAGVDMDDAAACRARAAELHLDPGDKHPDVVVSELFEATVEDALVGPVFVTDYPATICPLTKRKASDPRVAERFELFACGMELANAYTELNDPLLQEELFGAQLAGQKEEDSMAKMDHDFVTALKHGMPPAGGLGIGIDRLVMLLTDSPTIRDVIVFPLLRPEA